MPPADTAGGAALDAVDVANIAFVAVAPPAVPSPEGNPPQLMAAAYNGGVALGP